MVLTQLLDGDGRSFSSVVSCYSPLSLVALMYWAILTSTVMEVLVQLFFDFYPLVAVLDYVHFQEECPNKLTRPVMDLHFCLAILSQF